MFDLQVSHIILVTQTIRKCEVYPTHISDSLVQSEDIIIKGCLNPSVLIFVNPSKTLKHEDS